MKCAASGLILAVGLTACTSYGGLDAERSQVAVQSQLPPPDPRALAAAQTGYHLGPSDGIFVRVYGAEDLQTKVTLDTAGAFNMPLVGRVAVGGLTTSEASSLIADRLRGRFLRNPQVTIEVTEPRSQVVTIDGAVTVPGVYPVTTDLTLQSAIATARGATEYAQLDEVAVFRVIDGQENAALFSLKDIREGRYPDPKIYANDRIVVGESGSRRLFRDIAQIAPVFGVFTPFLYNGNNNNATSRGN